MCVCVCALMTADGKREENKKNREMLRVFFASCQESR